MPNSDTKTVLPYKKPEKSIKILILGPNNSGRSSLARLLQQALAFDGVTAFVEDDGVQEQIPLGRAPKHIPIDIEVVTTRSSLINVNDLLEQIEVLSRSLTLLGAQKFAQEHKAQAELSSLGLKFKALVEAVRERDAATAEFEEAEETSVPTDAQTQRAAEAAGKLESLLEQSGF